VRIPWGAISMLNNQESSATDSVDALVDSSLNAKLFELSQRHRLKTTVFLVAALATLTWGFSFPKTDAINAKLLDERQAITLSQQ